MSRHQVKKTTDLRMRLDMLFEKIKVLKLRYADDKIVEEILATEEELQETVNTVSKGEELPRYLPISGVNRTKNHTTSQQILSSSATPLGKQEVDLLPSRSYRKS